MLSTSDGPVAWIAPSVGHIDASYFQDAHEYVFVSPISGGGLDGEIATKAVVRPKLETVRKRLLAQ